MDNPYFVFLFHSHLSAKLRMFQHRQKRKKRPPRNSKTERRKLNGPFWRLRGGKTGRGLTNTVSPPRYYFIFFFEVGARCLQRDPPPPPGMCFPLYICDECDFPPFFSRPIFLSRVTRMCVETKRRRRRRRRRLCRTFKTT